MKIGLVACSARKLDKAAPAEELYSKSTLFRYAVGYAKKNYDKVYVLSALHGLVPLDKVLEPYNATLNKMRAHERDQWVAKVKDQVMKEIPLGSELFFHAGAKYREIVEAIQGDGEKKNYVVHIPLEHLGIGRQLHWYKEKVNAKKEEKPTTEPVKETAKAVAGTVEAKPSKEG